MGKKREITEADVIDAFRYAFCATPTDIRALAHCLDDSGFGKRDAINLIKRMVSYGVFDRDGNILTIAR